MPNVLMIVSRDSPALYSYVRREFEGLGDEIDVIVDRRHGERRRGGPNASAERRQADRRAYEVQADLRALGWALVRRDLGGPPSIRPPDLER
jgi:hypothetical protein